MTSPVYLVCRKYGREWNVSRKDPGARSTSALPANISRDGKKEL